MKLLLILLEMAVGLPLGAQATWGFWWEKRKASRTIYTRN